MESAFALPLGWVFVHFEDGKKKNVAHRNNLNEEIAISYKKQWELASGKKIVSVTFEDSDGVAIKEYEF